MIEVDSALLHSNVITFSSRDIDKSLYLQLKRPQGQHSTTQRLRSSSTSCFKYFVIIKFKKFCKTNALMVVDMLVGSCIVTWNMLINSKVTSLTFFFKNSFWYKIQKHPPELFYKKAVVKTFGILTEKHPLWCFFLIKLQAWSPEDCCRTYLLHAPLRLYSSLGKTLKKLINFL